MATREIQLFFYEGYNGQRVGNRMPVFDGGNLKMPDNDDEVASLVICDTGRAVFGIKEPVPENKIVRVTVEVKAVEVGEYEVKADFKPFAPAKPARKARRR